MSRNPQHKSRAITYITPERREAAEKEQFLVGQGKGLARRRLNHLKESMARVPIFTVDSRAAGSFDPVQAEKNKALGYW